MSAHAWVPWEADSRFDLCLRCGALHRAISSHPDPDFYVRGPDNGRWRRCDDAPPCLEGLWDALIDDARTKT